MANASHVKAVNRTLVRLPADIPAKTLARLRSQPLAISRFKGPGQA